MTLPIKKASIFAALVLGLFLSHPASAAEIGGRAVFDAVNAERVASGLRALTPDAALVKAAQMKADEMARLHYFAHKSPTKCDAWCLVGKAKGRGYSVVGDNLAESFITTEALVAGWMKSPTHKANILDKQYRKTGIAITRDGEKLIIVQFFAD